MAEFDHDSESTSSNSTTESASGSTLFIKIKSIPRVAFARDLRLKEDDIILANNGKILEQDINAFTELCDQAQDNEQQLLLTICRGEVIFDLLVAERLGVELDFCDTESSSAAALLFAKHHVGAKDQYFNYEALRDIHRHVVLYDTRYSSVATIAPPIWLMQNRAWEPLVAVSAAYATSFAVHWSIFLITILLIAIYFHRIQFRLIRNYSLFTEHYFWHVCAARSTAEAQLVCRQLDPKCSFDYSHVGPPDNTSTEPQPTQQPG
ncbi:MAG: hypothetical protein ACJ0BO_05485 [Candidatus Puniceispirillaceae bacterium]